MKRLKPHEIEPDVTDNLVLTTASGVAVWAPPAPGAGLVPLTTVSGGEPQLVWDDDDQLVMTEAPL